MKYSDKEVANENYARTIGRGTSQKTEGENMGITKTIARGRESDDKKGV